MALGIYLVCSINSRRYVSVSQCRSVRAHTAVVTVALSVVVGRRTAARPLMGAEKELRMFLISK